MTANARKAVTVLAGTAFAVGTVAIHYQVKVVMAPSGGAAVDRAGNVAVGDEAPEFSTTDLIGSRVVLSEARGAVVLDFWATWCGPCLVSMPDLQEVYNEYDGRGVEILAVNLGEDPGLIQEYLERHKYTFRVVADEDQAIGNLFGIRAIPTMVVIGPDRRVEWIRVGASPSTDKALRRVLDRLVDDVPAGGRPAL